MKRAAFSPVLLAVAAVSLVALDARAQDVRVIQNRSYTVNHEFTAQLGVLPLDVLYKAPTITGRYTWHGYAERHGRNVQHVYFEIERDDLNGGGASR